MLTAALIALPTLADEKKAAATPTPSAARESGPNTAARGKPTKEQRISGKVIRLSDSTFTVLSGGKEVTLSGAKLKALPKVGEVLDVTYTQTPGGPLEATTVKSSKSNTSC